MCEYHPESMKEEGVLFLQAECPLAAGGEENLET